MRASRPGIIIAALPGIMLLALFYTLAIHMHQALGSWPTSIGEHGFPPALLTHSAITWKMFALVLLGLMISPVPILLCLLVKRWRRLAVYFAIYGGVILVCLALMQFAAPAQFLHWWRD